MITRTASEDEHPADPQRKRAPKKTAGLDRQGRPLTWKGGIVRYDASGEPTYIIRRMVNTRRYVISTRAHSLEAAGVHLDRFEKDPEGYDPRGHVRPEAIPLDVKLAEAFLAWSAKPKKEGGRGNTPRWVHEQKLYLDWWSERLRGVDLRRLSYEEHVAPAMEGATAQRQRGATLLALYRFLRKERGLSLTEDPVHGRLTFGEPEPEQVRRSKVVPTEHIDLVIEHLTSPWREVLTIQAGTAWHVTEVERFAVGGSIEPLPRNVTQEGVAAVLVCPRHKSGESIRTRVSAAVVEAAKRLRAHGSFSRGHTGRGGSAYFRAVRSACSVVKRPDGEIGIPAFTPGMIRASVATHAVNAGVDPAAVASFLGHRTKKTTERFYSTLASVAKIPTVR
jgi:integrase